MIVPKSADLDGRSLPSGLFDPGEEVNDSTKIVVILLGEKDEIKARPGESTCCCVVR
jgi:hypothetical protein